jgi:hypothetical protein
MYTLFSYSVFLKELKLRALRILILVHCTKQINATAAFVLRKGTECRFGEMGGPLSRHGPNSKKGSSLPGSSSSFHPWSWRDVKEPWSGKGTLGRVARLILDRCHAALKFKWAEHAFYNCMSLGEMNLLRAVAAAANDLQLCPDVHCNRRLESRLLLQVCSELSQGSDGLS